MGNCTVVWIDGQALFIDAGVSRKLLDEFVLEHGVKPRALLVTHAHADHLTNPAVNFFREHSAPIYIGHADAIRAFSKYLPALRKYRDMVKIFSGPFNAGDFCIEPFSLDHDSMGGCFGFAVKIDGKKVVVATDLVNTPPRLKQYFNGADAVVFESNHDVEMLKQSSRPEYLKQRIRERGHLSNEKSAAFLADTYTTSGTAPQYVFLAHISHECNTHAKAHSVHESLLLPVCGNGTVLHLTHRDKSSVIACL